MYAGRFDGDEQATLELGPDRHAWVQVARGSIEVNGERLGAGDGAELSGERTVAPRGGKGAEVLVFDLA